MCYIRTGVQRQVKQSTQQALIVDVVHIQSASTRALFFLTEVIFDNILILATDTQESFFHICIKHNVKLSLPSLDLDLLRLIS